MLKPLILSLVFMTIFCRGMAQSQDIFAGYEHLFTTPKQYTAYQTKGRINIDGKLNEASWNDAPWSDYFTDIEGNLRPEPPLKTRFKLLWDSQYVYIAAEIEEPHIWATLKQHDAIIYHDNDFEIFIDPNGDTHNYFEIEVNPYNAIFDLFLPKPYRNGGLALLNWDVQQLRSAVSIIGTLNNPKDVDKKWFIEMAIPFHSISLGDSVQVPKDQSTWRINFSRVEWDTQIIGNTYVKKKDSATKRFLPEHNWVWSPQGAVNMHMPERWGYLHFSTKRDTADSEILHLPLAEEMKKYLWLVYYKQQTYKRQHGQYAAELSQINIPSLFDITGLHCSIAMQTVDNQFVAIITSVPDNQKWQINQEGNIIKL